MKKTGIVLACALTLSLLFGCRAQSDGEYYVDVPHAQHTKVKEFPNSNSISSFYSLRNAVMNIIRAGRINETLRVSDYNGNLDDDLKTITTEMTTENPLGMYAVSSILFEQTSILSYRELKVTMQYRRTTEEIRTISEVLSMYDFERSMTDVFQAFEDGHVFSFSVFSDTDINFRRRLAQCWAANPATAVGLGELNVVNYPEKAQNRIVEISVHYLEETDVLKKQQQELEEAAVKICAQFQGETESEKLEFVAQYLRGSVTYVADEAVEMTGATVELPRIPRYTAYGALIERKAAQPGMVLAAKLLCRQLGIDSELVLGEKDGAAYQWLAIESEAGTLHFDVTSDVYREEMLASTTTTAQPETPQNPAATDPTGATSGNTQQLEIVRKLVFTFTTEEAAKRLSWDETFYQFD